MEGVAGQGAPVAVAAAMLIGLGFSAIPAAVICLIANTPPVPFGPVGVPTSMMISVTKINAEVMTKAIGSDMCLMALIIPVFMLVVLAGWKRAIEVLPAAGSPAAATLQPVSWSAIMLESSCRRFCRRSFPSSR